MPESPQAVIIGHAIVDVLAQCDDREVEDLGLVKGTMELIDGGRADRIYEAIDAEAEVSGGSAANTSVCFTSFGGRARFVGRVADDRLGKVFEEDIRAAGVVFDAPSHDTGVTAGSGRCLILVTPDAEKTMCTSLGAGAHLGPEDIPVEEIEACQVLYMEGYVWGLQPTTSAVERAIEAARRGQALVAFSASDPGWVALQRDALLDLLGKADLLFANEPEAFGLSGRDDLEAAVGFLLERCPSVVVTLGAEGCLAAGRDGVRVRVPAAPVQRVIDTTGAGDSFAGGFLYGLVNGLGLEASARLGADAAAEVVSHLGARPTVSLRERAVAAGLL